MYKHAILQLLKFKRKVETDPKVKYDLKDKADLGMKTDFEAITDLEAITDPEMKTDHEVKTDLEEKIDLEDEIDLEDNIDLKGKIGLKRKIDLKWKTNFKVTQSAAFQYYRDVRESEWVPVAEVLYILAGRFCAARDRTGILEVINDYRKLREDIPMLRLEWMITTLSHHSDAESVQGLFSEYVGRSGKPTRRIFLALLNIHHKRIQPTEIVKCFDKLRKEFGFIPDERAWNYVISTHALVGDVIGAERWLAQMIQAGRQPDSRSYGTMLQMYAKRGDVEAVQRLFERLEAAGVRQSTTMIEGLVLTLVKNDKLDEARKVAEDALHMAFQDRRTKMWNYLINAHGMRGDLAKVKETYERMREAGVPFDGTTYSALLQSLVTKREPDTAHKILNKIMPRAGVQPSSLHYAVVMAGYLDTESYDQVIKVYDDMLKKKIKPTHSTQNALIRAVGALESDRDKDSKQPGKLSLTRAVLKDTLAKMDPAEFVIRQPIQFVGPDRLDDAFTSKHFAYLIFLYGKAHAFDKVRELYDEYVVTAMKFQTSADFSPTIEILSALLVANAEARDYKEVDRCWHQAVEKAEKIARPSHAVTGEEWRALHSRRFALNVPLCHYILCLENQKRTDDIIATVDHLRTMGYELDSRAWNTYVQILSRSGREKLAYSVCEQELMNNWVNWREMGSPSFAVRKFTKIKRDRRHLAKRFPAYQTFVFLAAAYKKVRINGTKAVWELNDVAPRTLYAVGEMPQLSDQMRWQERLLGESEYS
jgi:pentatricopeptide repeat-containing protein PET309